MKLDETLRKQYLDVIDSKDNTENDIQKFLEENTIFIPTPSLNNHGLHFHCVISKFKLGNEFVTDFAFLTKDSYSWDFVLIELEDAKKKIFTNNRKRIEFHSDFNHAYDQITSWKSYVKKNKERILHQIDKLRVPLSGNSVNFKYILVIGRNSETDGSQKKIDMVNEKNVDGIKIMTYDSLLSACEKSHYEEKIILSPWQEQGFKIKNLPKEDIETQLFAYLYPDFLDIPNHYIEKLKKHGYDMDSWLTGKLLIYNYKYTAESFKKNTTNPLAKAFAQAETNKLNNQD